MEGAGSKVISGRKAYIKANSVADQKCNQAGCSSLNYSFLRTVSTASVDLAGRGQALTMYGFRAVDGFSAAVGMPILPSKPS